MGRKRTSNVEGVNTEIYKTTIVFRGIVKEFVLELGNNKSAIINSLLFNAIKSRMIEEPLTRSLPTDKIKYLLDKYTQSVNETNKEIQFANDGKPQMNKGENNGFDFY